MGFIRGAVVFIISLIMFLTFFSGGAFLTFNKSLEYNVVQPQILELSQDISERIDGARFLDLDYTFADDFYYKEYDCQMFDCLKEDQGYLVLVSEKAKIYWKNMFHWSLLLSVILLILLLIVAKPKNSAFIISGILMIAASLIYKKLSWIMSLVPNEFFVKFSNLFTSKSEDVFLIMIITGGALLLLGIVLHFFNWSMKLSNWISKILEKRKAEKVEYKIKEVKDKNKKLKKENKKLKEKTLETKPSDTPDEKLAKNILKEKTVNKNEKLKESPDQKLTKKILKDKQNSKKVVKKK
jgi:hypothetical protein